MLHIRFNLNLILIVINFVRRALSVGINKVGVVLAAADTVTFMGSELDVASITPARAPGVSDDPVVLTTFITITDHSDGVVNLGWAGGRIEDTTSVLLEVAVSGSKSNRDNTRVEGSLVLID